MSGGNGWTTRVLALGLVLALPVLGCGGRVPPTPVTVEWPLGTPVPSSYQSHNGYSIVLPSIVHGDPLSDPNDDYGFAETWGPIFDDEDAVYFGVFTADPDDPMDEAALESYERGKFIEAGGGVRSGEWIDTLAGRTWIAEGSVRGDRPVAAAFVVRPDRRLWGVTLTNGTRRALIEAVKSLRIKSETTVATPSSSP